MTALADFDRRCTFLSDRLGAGWTDGVLQSSDAAHIDAIEETLSYDDSRSGEITTRLRAMAARVPAEPGLEWAALTARLQISLDALAFSTQRVGISVDVPFAQALTPFVEDFHRGLENCDLWLSQENKVRAQITDGLVFQLSRIASMVLHCELSDKCSPKSVELQQFEEFTSSLLAGGWLDLCRDYPVLLRLLTTKIDTFQHAVIECLVRLQNDRSIIENAGLLTDLTKLIGFSFGRGETHNCGRSVIHLTFSNGEELFYKPKALANDHWFFAHVVPTLRRVGVPIGELCVVDCGSYGWVESVRGSPGALNRGASETAKGRLLALAWALNATDLHFENLLVVDGLFFPIDLETILGASPISEEDGDENWRRWTVLSTDMLQARFGSEGRKSDVSGFSAKSFVTPFPHFSFINDYNGIPRLRIAKPTDPDVEARRSGAVSDNISTSELTDAFVSSVQDLRAPLLSALQAAPPELESRLVIRPTLFYERLFQRLLMPRFLRDATTFSIELSRLHSGLSKLNPNKREEIKNIVNSEIEQIQKGDIPHFTYFADRLEVFTNRSRISGVSLEATGIEVATAKLSKFKDSDIAEQVRLIEASAGLASHHWNEKNRKGTAHVGQFKPGADHAGFSKKVDEFALALAVDIVSAHHKLPNGRTRWIGHIGDAAGKSLIPVVTDDSYFGGYWGIVVFLERASTRNIANIEAATCLQEFLKNEAEARRKGSGYNPGIQSVVGIDGTAGYLLAVSRLLDTNPQRWGFLLASAEQLVVDLPARLGMQQGALDYIGGDAGLVLSLLRIKHHLKLSENLVPSVIQMCIHRLLASAKRSDSLGLHWPSPLGANGLLGFAHGNAGYLAALAQLITDYERGNIALSQENVECCYEMIADGMRFEHQLCSTRFWPDLRDTLPSGTPANTSWCHGLAGIGLAKLAILQTSRFNSDVMLRREVRELATAVKDQNGANVFDTACCGSGGEWIFLARSAALLDDGEMKPSDIVLEALDRIQQVRGYRGFMGQRSRFDLSPSLFQGAAGVGEAVMAIEEFTMTDLYGLKFYREESQVRVDA